MIHLGILGSTRGTTMNAIHSAIEQKRLSATIEVVISNQANALILERATILGLNIQFIDPAGFTRETYDHQVSACLQQYCVDLVVLIGYMRILSNHFIDQWKNKIINIHPSLLPAFAGKMDLDVHRAVLAADIKETGCTVHYVIQEIDAGPIILQKRCAVLPHDTPETLKARVQALEGEALVEAIAQLN
ncbi:MAG TPA: phosphoribosylglycinamide formyltransferase [Gammaproteobacteria bacterium]|nr:phosphoribosylglycinamide formyltransferase [Gammaproteobacteria bacterium]